MELYQAENVIMTETNYNELYFWDYQERIGVLTGVYYPSRFLGKRFGGYLCRVRRKNGIGTSSTVQAGDEGQRS